MRKKFNNFFWGVVQWLPLILIFVSFIMFTFINQRGTISNDLIFDFIKNDSVVLMFENINIIDINYLLTQYLNIDTIYCTRIISCLINWFILVYIVEILYLVFAYLLQYIKRLVEL